ncbi:hypothetical protein D3C71_78930 [compost metagenome]
MFNFEIRKIYSFDVYPAAVLGNGFQNVTVLAVMDQESANQLVDTQSLHVNVYPYLPTGTPNRPDAYSWLKIRTANGETTVLGLPWINEASITEVNSTEINVKIGNVQASDVPAIVEALKQNGFVSLVVTVGDGT